MKALLKLLLLVFHLAIFGIGGWYGWDFWLRHCALEEEKFGLEAACTQLRADNERLATEARRVAEAKDSLGRSLVTAVEAERRTQEANRRLEDENGRLKAEVADAGRQLRADLKQREETLRVVQAKLEAAEARLRTNDGQLQAAEAARARSPQEPGVDSLRELVELTDRAPRKAD